MSSDAATNVVAARFSSTDTTAVASGTTGVVVWNSTQFDTNGSKSGNTYIVSVAGKYKVSGFFSTTSAAVSANGYGLIQILKDGGTYSNVAYDWVTVAETRPLYLPFSDVVDCVAGSIISIQFNNQSGSSKSNSGNAFLNIERISGPAQIAASEFISPTIQTFTSGSGTYTLPSSVRRPKYIKVSMVGGGGGGGASNNSGGGGTGGNTTFGSSLLTANGGVGSTYLPGSGGSATISSPAYGTSMSGAYGNPGPYPGTVAGDQIPGGAGASSFFGGAGISTNQSGAAGSAITNSGSGGGGGATLTTNQYTGAGGGAGGYIEAIIPSPSATYTYAIGAAGTAGTGTGLSGGAGGSGLIIVTEYYQ
jgi:hypothetical protein